MKNCVYPGTYYRHVSLAVMVPIDRYFSYNIHVGLFVQDLQKKKFALASRPKEELEQQDPTMPVCPPKLLNRPTGNFATHRKGEEEQKMQCGDSYP